MKIKDLLAKPEAWTKGSSARNKDGDVVMVNAHDACSWCLYGAALKCYPYNRALEVCELTRPVTKGSVILWNDHAKRTYQEVLALVTKLDI